MRNVCNGGQAGRVKLLAELFQIVVGVHQLLRDAADQDLVGDAPEHDGGVVVVLDDELLHLLHDVGVCTLALLEDADEGDLSPDGETDSPKSDKTRRSCAAAVGTLLHSPVLFASMQSAHSLPIKALAQQCGVSARTLTRHRDYIVAAALLIDGDYPILGTYLQTMRKEAEQCVR